MKKFFLSLFSLLAIVTLSAQTLGGEGVHLNKAVYDGVVISVWEGENLPQGFTGEGVIIGVMDWGFDYSHPVFYDLEMDQYRVLRAWDQFKQQGPAPDGFTYGREYIGREQLLEAAVDTSNVYGYGYHGTHVAGIAGGAGAGTTYKGVAYDANLIFTTFLVTEQAVMDAMDWMYQVAQEEGKRLVINMSWGLYYPDNFTGTGPIGQKIEELTDLGVVFVTSGGNNGDVDLHISHDFTTDLLDTMRSQITYAYPYPNQYGQSITMTNAPNMPFTFGIQIFNNNFEPLGYTPFYSTENEIDFGEYFWEYEGDTLYYTLEIESADPNNGRPEVRMRVKNLPNTNWKIALCVVADQGVFHAWNVIELTTDVGNWGADFVQPEGFDTWIAGDPYYGVGTPAVAESAITIAAHNSEVMGLGGNISGFSSYGPTIDERQKPDVSAPGSQVVSSISSFTNDFQGPATKTVTFNGKNYIFGKASGTSMSSPFTAGVVALMLQANPYLTAQQVKDILIETARNDSYTEAAGMRKVGHGKVDAYQAVLKALETVGVENYQTNTTIATIFPNPSNGQLYISLQSNERELPIQIFDISGKIIYQDVVMPGVNSLALHHLHNGCYFIKINDAQKSTTYKWIKTQ